MKFKTREKRSLPEINTSSLPDIIFMLLFFFMVVTVIRKDKDIEVIDIPQVNYAELFKSDKTIVLSIAQTTGGLSYYIDDKAFRTLNAVESALRKRYINDRDFKVKLAAEKGIAMQDINAVKQVLQGLQYFNVDYLAKAFK